MFTGIITDLGTIANLTEGAKSRRAVIHTRLDLNRAAVGASIACNGCCLTVVEKTKDTFTVDIAAETLEVTTLGRWKVGDHINLETSLKVGDELGGHIVSGHVDGLATVKSMKQDGDAWRLSFEVPKALAPFIAPKGSITVNGVSLTVNEVEGATFGVCLIPHTWDVTNLSALKPGDQVNLEIDMLARYVARLLGREAA